MAYKNNYPADEPTVRARYRSRRSKGLSKEERGGEIDIRSRPFYKLLVLSSVFGIMAALLTIAFFFAYKYGIMVLWEACPKCSAFRVGQARPST